MPADALRNWRAAGKWEQAVRLAEAQVRSDLDWLVELEAVTRRRPAGQRKRLTAGERERLVQLLDTVERFPRSGRTATAATVLPLVILPGLGPGLPPGSVEADGMPPVPAKARTGRFFSRRVMEFQNWDARLQREVAVDRRAVWRRCGRPSFPTRASATR